MTNLEILIYLFSDYFGLGLGKWVNRQRVAYRAKVANNQTEMKKYKITDKEISLLDELGMVWDSSEINKFNSTPELIVRYYIKKYFKDAKKLLKGDFLKTELDIYIPSKRIGIEFDGVAWHNQKEQLDLSKNKICMDNGVQLIRIRENGLSDIAGSENYFVVPDDFESLERVIETIVFDIGKIKINCDVKRDFELILSEHRNYVDYYWNTIFFEIKENYVVDGRAVVRQKDVSVTGQNLYNWICGQRSLYKKGELIESRKEKLESIGLVLDPVEELFNNGYNHLVEYYKEHGDCKVIASYHCSDGFFLGKWVSHRRGDYKHGKLSQDRIDKLNALNFTWSIHK